MNHSSVRGRPPITLHNQAKVTGDDPWCITTPGTAWAYAASFPADGAPDGERVAELVVRVHDSRVGVSFVDPAGQNLRHEVMVGPTPAPVRIPQLIAPGERGRVMIRTGADGVPARVDIHELRVRPVAAEELADRDVPAVLQPVEGWSAFYGNHAASVAQQLRSLWFARLQGETARAWIEGLSLIVAPDEQISRAACVSGLYEPNIALVLKSWLRPGSVLLDVGANIGLFTMLASRWVGPAGRVIAVEPSPRERRRLAEHVRVNALRNVDVVAAAVAGREGSGELLVATSEHSGLNTLGRRFAYTGVTAAETVAVSLVTLDSLAATAALTRVDVIKLDVEGGEYDALTGAASVLRRFRPRLILEVLAPALEACGASAGDLDALLRAAGYELFEVDDRGALNPVPDLRRLREHNVAGIPRESL